LIAAIGAENIFSGDECGTGALNINAGRCIGAATARRPLRGSQRWALPLEKIRTYFAHP